MKTLKHIQVAAGVVVREDHILLVRRHAADIPEYDNKWELPAGKIESGESVTQAAIREIEEETGYKTRFEANVPFDYEADLALMDPPLFVEVKCIVTSLLGDDPEAPVPPQPPAEGSQDHKWVRFGNVPYDDTIVGSREFIMWTAHHLGYPIPRGIQVYGISMESVELSSNRFRTYELAICYDPSERPDPYRLQIRHGRITSHMKAETQTFATMSDALNEAKRRVRLRKQHGYKLTALASTHPLRSWLLALGLTPEEPYYPTLFSFLQREMQIIPIASATIPRASLGYR